MTLHNIYHYINQDVAEISPSLLLTIFLYTDYRYTTRRCWPNLRSQRQKTL